MNFTIIMAWLAVIVAVEAVTEIIVASKILFSLRDWLSKPIPEDDAALVTNVLVAKKRNWFKRFLYWLRSFCGELINCGHCTSVWVALLAAHFAPTGACTGCVKYAWPIFFIKVFVIHRLSNLMHELFKKWFRCAPFSFVFTHIHNGDDDNGPKKS